jgi:hypothetical protein
MRVLLKVKKIFMTGGATEKCKHLHAESYNDIMKRLGSLSVHQMTILMSPLVQFISYTVATHWRCC